MAVDRRRFLAIGAAGAAQVALAGAGLTGCASSPSSFPGAASTSPSADDHPFQHGVASGDPLADRVILWTRLSPRPSEVGAALPVRWWIARDAAGQDRVAEGLAKATADRDYTLKIDATGLEAATEYFYSFEFGDPTSPGGRSRSTLGRTRTAALSGFEPIRFATVSCSNYPEGFFNAYAAIARQDDLDFVVHLGDYLYEYGNGQYGDGTGIGRVPDPVHETISLDDYRRRHSTYKRDPDLQAAHARHPWITVWDDHESADNSFFAGANNHQAGEGEWSVRRLAAMRAYYEWMPVRELPTGLFRHFRFGDLAELIMLDTRLAGRDEQVGPKDHAGASDPARSILGFEQEAQLLAALSDAQRTGRRWKVIGQQTPFSPLTDGTEGFNPDSWDGYRGSRRRVLEHLEAQTIEGVVILTGDYHSSWAFEVPPPIGWDAGTSDTAPEPRALEFVTPAVSSRPSGQNPRARERFADSLERHPHLKFLDVVHQGFIRVELDRARVRAEWIFTGDARQRSDRTECGAVFESAYGTNRLERVRAADCSD